MKTSGLGRFSLGQPVPARPHAVCVSLPKVSDLIGYEEKDPGTLAAMPSGYPRFVRHQLVNQMIEHLAQNQGMEMQGYLFAKERDCKDVIERYQLSGSKVEHGESYTFLQIDRKGKKIAK